MLLPSLTIFIATEVSREDDFGGTVQVRQKARHGDRAFFFSHFTSELLAVNALSATMSSSARRHIRLRRHRLQVGQPLTPVVDFKEPATAPLAFIMNPCLIATLPFDKT